MDDVGNVEVSWNLLVEPWIPVVKGDGAREVVSLRGLFEEAPDIREISGDCPQQTIVLIRLALAILYRAYCDPDLTEPEMLDLWVRIWLQGRFDIDVVNGYLDKHVERFDLFGDNPFMQVKGLSYLPGKEREKREKRSSRFRS